MAASPFTPEQEQLLKKLIQLTQHLKSGIPSAKVCQLILADRGYTVDYNFARRLVNAVLKFRREKIKAGHSAEKVGEAKVNTDLITAKNKGKLVARPRGDVLPAPTKAKGEEAPQKQPVIHHRTRANYGPCRE